MNTYFLDLEVVFCGTFRLRPGNVVRDIVGGHVNEFMSRYSLQWKFAYLDHRWAYAYCMQTRNKVNIKNNVYV